MSDDLSKQSETGHEIVKKVSRTAPPNRPVIYSNSTVVFGNQWDIQMYFGLMTETTPGNYEAVDQALVVMTPEHALAFSKALQRNLEAFESRGGKIREVKRVEVDD